MARIEEARRRAKKRGARFDCICPVSGGKDSAYVLYYAKRKLNLKVLAVTTDNGVQDSTVLARAAELAHSLGVEHRLVGASKRNLGKLFQAGIEPCVICMKQIWAHVFQVAWEEQVPLIIHGDSPEQMLDYGLNWNSDNLFSQFEHIGDRGYFWRTRFQDYFPSFWAFRRLWRIGKTMGWSRLRGIRWCYSLRRQLLDTIEHEFSYLHGEKKAFEFFCDAIRGRLEEETVTDGIDILPFFFFHAHNEKEMIRKLEAETPWRASLYRGLAAHPDCLFKRYFTNLSAETNALSHYVRTGRLSRKEAIDDLLLKVHDVSRHGDVQVRAERLANALEIDPNTLSHMPWVMQYELRLQSDYFDALRNLLERERDRVSEL